MNYFEFVPIELISQILLYLDVDEIEQSIEVYPQFKSVINQKIFWIMKLKLDKLSDYIPYLGTIKEGIRDYHNFRDINIYINNFMRGFKEVGAHLYFNISNNIDIKELINNFTLKEFSNNVSEHPKKA